MKDKEKQIEEMAEIMCSPCPDGKECSGTWCYKRVLDCANEFYEQGYRKLPEDSVVLSREEYEKGVIERESMRNQITELFNDREELKETTEQLRKEIITLSQELVNSRKEMAEKFVDLLTNNGKRQTLPIEDNKGSICDKAYIIPQSHLRQVAKQLGVEIKE